LIVDQAPAITSANTTTFTVGTPGSFTVTATGYPNPTLSEKTTDILPGGITFQPSTGVLSGAPSSGSVGVYTLNFTAHNGIGNDATQTFTLDIIQTGASTTTVASNASTSFSTSAQNVTLSATVTSPGGTVNEGTETFTLLSGSTVMGTAVTVNVALR